MSIYKQNSYIIPSEVWRDLIFVKFLSYTDILNFMEFIKHNKTNLYKRFIIYAFEEYKVNYIDIMVLYIRNIFITFNMKYNIHVLSFILNDNEILFNIIRHHTRDMTFMDLSNITIKNIDKSDISHIIHTSMISIHINDFKIDIYNILNKHYLYMLTYYIIQTDIPHSIYGPSNIRWYNNGIKQKVVYYKQGQTHRIGGPATIKWNIDGTILSERYYIDDIRQE